jgi:hypothetical protein
VRSRSGRSTDRSRSTTGPLAAVDAYLLPAVVGGGLGDIEETLAAGRRLARAGVRVRLYRSPGLALPRSVDGPWDWPPLERVDRLIPRGTAALTVTPAWGVSAAPSRPGAYGRGGPWEKEAAAIEAAYGAERVVHVSLEEFARTLTPTEENLERFREGGVPARAIGARLRAARGSGEVARFRSAFRRFRAFDRPNVLHLFATLRPDPAFGREFPEAVQTGPLWPERFRARRVTSTSAGPAEWVWYASPASAERIAPAVVAGLASAAPELRLWILTPRPWEVELPSDRVDVVSTPVPVAEWTTRFARARLRIVTGSRTLLEAMELGGPFLYFNGTLGRGARTRRHRPEKRAKGSGSPCARTSPILPEVVGFGRWSSEPPPAPTDGRSSPDVGRSPRSAPRSTARGNCWCGSHGRWADRTHGRPTSCVRSAMGALRELAESRTINRAAG